MQSLYAVCKWQPAPRAGYKKTEICQTCSNLKLVCQVCILDLDHGLPVQARAGIDYQSSYGKARPDDTLLKLQRTQPYYVRNKPHVCSFYVRGGCTRGDECPYRHEMPITGDLAKQNIKDRYFGNKDPVALKLLNKAGEMPSLLPPADESVKTLYVGGLDNRISEDDLRDYFYAHGQIESLRMVIQRACAFVTYTTREEAEKAAEELSNKVVIQGLRLKLSWGKSQTAKKTLESNGGKEGRHGEMMIRASTSQQHNQYYQLPGTEEQQPKPFTIPMFLLPCLDRAIIPQWILRGWVLLLHLSKAHAMFLVPQDFSFLTSLHV
ncbi:hypothetical protein IFM89_005142 [Coptis chinensis]|uniref:Uncharacterized protein n=1 Tax=Coptis chinensis TaxID=261450 RepID=A0A835IM69_9MAGN|nr:hypothetical protein IFM89_005142 [Coptis chinensis]